MKLKEKGPVSVSRLQKFERCPWSYYLQYDLGKPEPLGNLPNSASWYIQ
ncbi:PD-(D/E)XK nuclease family protein [Syntrophomonas palmitatica]|nr:PD-(D/E)XK nuclease family protein [Syntrophomonas palmitatica]